MVPFALAFGAAPAWAPAWALPWQQAAPGPTRAAPAVPEPAPVPPEVDGSAAKPATTRAPGAAPRGTEAESLRKSTEATARARDAALPAAERAAAAIEAARLAYGIHATSKLALLQPDLDALRAAMTPAQAAQADVLLAVRLSWIMDMEAAHSQLAAAVARVHELAATDDSLQETERIGRLELAWILTNVGDFRGAQAEYDRLEQIARKPETPELPVWLLACEANFRERCGQGDLVETLVQRALDAAKASDDHKDWCDALLTKAAWLNSRGQTAEAEAACQEALKHAPTTHSRLTADAERARLAALRQPDPQPIDDLLRCLEESRELGDEALQVKILDFLHQAYAQLGDVVQARRYLQKAEEALGANGSPAVIAAIKSNLADTWDPGDPKVATLLDEARSLARSIQHHGLLAVIAGQAAYHHACRNEFAAAEPMEQEMLDEARMTGNRVLVAMALTNLVDIRRELGRPDLPSAELALSAALALDDWDPRVQAEIALALTATAVGELDRASEVLDEAGRTIEGVDRTRLGADVASQLRSRYEAFACAAEDLASHRLQALASLDLEPAELVRRRDALLAEGFELASRWKGRALMEVRRERAGQEPGIPSARPAQVQAALPDEHTALIEFVQGMKDLFAYVITRDAVVHARVVPTARADELVAAVSEAVGAPDAVPLPEVWTRCHAAWNELVAPLVPAGVESLVVVPALCVERLPMEALVLEPPPGPDERPRFAIDRYTVSYLPSSTALLELSSPRPAVARGSTARVLLLGDPELPDWARGYPPLRGARLECEMIARGRAGRTTDSPCWEDLVSGRADACEIGPLALRFGSAASAAGLLSSLDDFDLIHIAAHGRVDLADPARTGLLLAPADGRDGLLTLADIMASRLHADPVVLASCESAGGEFLGGEGRLSMARSFLMAGAGSVVASLWPVDDKSAVPLMVAFHQQLAAGDLPVAKALRAAKLATIGQAAAPGDIAMRGDIMGTPPARVSRLHPYWWAALVYIGPPR